MQRDKTSFCILIRELLFYRLLSVEQIYSHAKKIMKKPTKSSKSDKNSKSPQDCIQYGLDIINITMDMACILDDGFAKIFEKDMNKIIEAIG